jgi:uncharacterized membrane protein
LKGVVLKRISLLAATLVGIVLAIQLLTRSKPAPAPSPPAPKEQLPAIDPAPEPALPFPEPSDPQPIEDVARLEPAALRKFERRFMFDCDGNQFFVRIGDDEARLLPPGSLTGFYIPLARAGSVWRGRYANENILFRHDGDVGGFELGEHKFDDCVATRDRAALAEVNTGVTFQAFGDAPAWTLELVVPLGFVLTTDAGARQIQLPFREPIDSGAKITFRSVLGTQELVVVVDRIPCRDAPSGETFANAVTVTFDDEWYYGCGRFIAYR